jgi:hypothetical protein
MIKYLPKPIISEENEFENQIYTWLNDSHYWIQKSDTSFVCKWCGEIMPMILNHSTLCKKNLELLKLKDNILGLLSESNEILRSINSIIERKGKDTNWEAISNKVNNLLNKQHEILKAHLITSFDIKQQILKLNQSQDGISTNELIELLNEYTEKVLKENKK